MSHTVIDLTGDDSKSDSDDSQVQRAIATSLKDSKSHVKVVSDDEDPDLKEALRLSMESLQKPPVDISTEAKGLSPKNTIEEPKIQSFGGFDRKTLERERLARLERKWEKEPATNTVLSAPSLNERTPSFSSSGSTLAVPGRAEEIQYPNGAVKLTYVVGYIKKDEHISIEQVFQKDTLQAAVLSSFVIDHGWVLSKLNLGKHPILFVQHSSSIEEQNGIRQLLKSLPKVDVVFPMMKKVGCMHAKLQLLFHLEFLRVVIPTANLISQDWGEIGAMENDNFPRRTGPVETASQFCDDLVDFCTASKYPGIFIEKIKEYDFSKARVGIVHSIGGRHGGSNIYKTGYPLLSETVKRMGLEHSRVKLDYVTSSLGSLNENFVTRLYKAACGITDIEYRKASSNTWDEIKPAIKVYFPTHDTVVHSRYGPAFGGTICLNTRSYYNAEFQDELLRDCRSTREGCLMHNKIIKAEPQDSIGKSWHYVGSANMTASAWGNIVMERARKDVKLVVNNWESIGTRQKGIPLISLVGVVVPEGAMSVPEPVQKPGALYGRKEPWFFMNQ